MTIKKRKGIVQRKDIHQPHHICNSWGQGKREENRISEYLDIKYIPFILRNQNTKQLSNMET
jgi:hypothetical protein